MFRRQHIAWMIYAFFVAMAVFFHTGEPLFVSESNHPLGKGLVWATFFGFLGYSYYCSTRENLFTTMKTLWPFHWARQIGLDLYLGVAISSTIIYLNEGSLLVLALWLLPLVLFANLATLLYFAMNFDAIVTRFM